MCTAAEAKFFPLKFATWQAFGEMLFESALQKAKITTVMDERKIDEGNFLFPKAFRGFCSIFLKHHP